MRATPLLTSLEKVRGLPAALNAPRCFTNHRMSLSMSGAYCCPPWPLASSRSPRDHRKQVAEESGSRTHAGPPAAPTGFEVRPPHRERFPSVVNRYILAGETCFVLTASQPSCACSVSAAARASLITSINVPPKPL